MGKHVGTVYKWVNNRLKTALHVFNISMKLKFPRISPSDSMEITETDWDTNEIEVADIITVIEGEAVLPDGGL